MKKKNTKRTTFTKKWINTLLVVAVIDLQLPFILAFLGRDEIAESLAIAIVTEIVGVISGYMCKSYFETKQEKKQALDEKKFTKKYEDMLRNLNEEEE